MNLLDDKDEFQKSGLDLQEINRCIDHLEYLAQQPQKAEAALEFIRQLKKVRKDRFGVDA